MDGTVIDAVPSILRSMNETLEAMGHETLGLDDLCGGGISLDEVLLRRLAKEELVEGRRIYREIQYSTFQEDTRVFPGAREAITEWRRHGRKLAIFTLRKGDNARTVLSTFDLLDMFDAILGYDDVPAPKPAPEHVEAAASHLHMHPSETIVIGDNPEDILSGKGAGARTVGVLWGLRGREELESAGADHIAESWEHLARIVDEGMV